MEVTLDNFKLLAQQVNSHTELLRENPKADPDLREPVAPAVSDTASDVEHADSDAPPPP